MTPTRLQWGDKAIVSRVRTQTPTLRSVSRVGPIRLTAAKTTPAATARNPPRTPALTDPRTFAKQPPTQSNCRCVQTLVRGLGKVGAAPRLRTLRVALPGLESTQH